MTKHIGIGCCNKCGAYTVESETCDDCSHCSSSAGSLTEQEVHIVECCLDFTEGQSMLYGDEILALPEIRRKLKTLIANDKSTNAEGNGE